MSIQVDIRSNKSANIWILGLDMDDFMQLIKSGLLSDVKFSNTDGLRWGKGVLTFHTLAGDIKITVLTKDIITNQLDLSWEEEANT